MLPKKKTLIPRTKSDRIGSNLRKADAYVLGPKDYDEIPQLTAEYQLKIDRQILWMPISTS